MSRNASITLNIFGKDVSASSALKGVGREAQRAESGLGGLHSAGLRAGAALAVVGGAALKAGKAAAVDEAAQKRLALELRNTAGATDEQVAAVEDWITAQGKALGVADDKLRPAMQRLARSTGDVGEAQELATLAMDASAATGKDLETISDALAKAHDGNTGALARLGVKTKDASGKTMEFDAIVKSMSQTFEGQAAQAAGTFEGGMARLTVAAGEAEEAFGEALAPTLTKVVDVAADAASAFASMPEPMRDAVLGAAGLAGAIKLIGPAAMAIPGVRNQLGLLSQGFKSQQVAQSAFSGRMGTLGGGLRSAGTAAAGAAGPIALVAAAVVGVAVAADQFEKARLSDLLGKLERQMDEATIAGESLADAIYNGQGVDAMVAAINRGTYSVKQLTPQFEALDGALQKMSTERAAIEFEEIARQAESSGMSVEDLRALLPGYAAKTREAARASAEQAQAEGDKATSLDAATDAQKAAVEGMVKAIRLQLALSGSTDALAGMTDRLTAAHKDNGRSLDIRKEAGRRNRDALRSEMEVVLAHSQAVVDNALANGATTEAAYAKGERAIRKGKRALVESAESAGFAKGEVAKYLTEIAGIPATVKTKFSATGTVTITDVSVARGVRNKLNAQLPGGGGMGPSGTGSGVMQATMGVGRPGATFGQWGPAWSWNRRNGKGQHDGADVVGTGTGTPVYATRAGQIVGTGNGGWAGKHVVWESGGTRFIYAHLSSIARNSGYVGPGMSLGRTGSTGNSSGPHLHVQASRNGRYVDPNLYLEHGGSFIAPRRPGGTAFVAGEGAFAERVTVEPLNGRNGTGGITVNFNGPVYDKRGLAEELRRILVAEKRFTGQRLGLS